MGWVEHPRLLLALLFGAGLILAVSAHADEDYVRKAPEPVVTEIPVRPPPAFVKHYGCAPQRDDGADDEATGRIVRDRSAVRRFQRENLPPAACGAQVLRRDRATGEAHLVWDPAANCVVDHVWPLCAGGCDAPENMAWMLRDEARRKDRLERRACLRKGEVP